MNYLNSWGDIITASIQNLWIRLITVLPSILGGIIVLIIGFFIASALGDLARRLIQMTRADKLMHEHPISEGLRDSQIHFTPSMVVGWLVKWFFILVTLIAVANSLGWSQINEFLSAIAFYIPNVLIAVIILMVGLVISRFVGSLIRTTLEEGSSLTRVQANFIASFIQTAITVFAIMASLVQLRIASNLIQILFAGIVFALSLAFGLAFGLGGRERASRLLESADLSRLRKRNDNM